MTTRLLLPLLAAALLVTGCTHRKLADSTVLTAGTVVDIQYRTVLCNLARMSCRPEDLPSHIDLADGVVQVSDGVGFGQSGGFDATDAGLFGIDRYGPSGSRQVSEQWGADATTDPQRLVELQDLYRAALGLPPLAPPIAIALLREDDERAGRTLRSNDDAGGSDAGGSGGGESGGSGSSSNGSGSSSKSAGGGTGSRKVPVDLLLADVPAPGWFGLGSKGDVPDDACHVGRHGDRYAWVTPRGVGGLSRFTVLVLAVVKLQPGPGGDSDSGLVVTR